MQTLIHPPDGLNALLPKDAVRLKKLVSGGLTELIGQQQMGSNVSKGLRIDIEKLAIEVWRKSGTGKNNDPVEYFNRMSTSSLLISAWELTNNRNKRHELWQFLKHCRNAAAHAGTFHFKPGEPKRPAKWRTLEIKASLQGKPLFSAPMKDGFIGPGDVIYLLADIEATLMP